MPRPSLANVDAAFQSALCPQSHSSLGLRLERLTFGHVLLLYRVSPELIIGGTITLQHVMLGSFACSQPWRDSERDLGKWWFSLWFRLWTWKLKRAQVVDCFDSFTDYIEAETKQPAVKITLGSGGGSCATPWPLGTMTQLVTAFGMKWDDCLDMPVALGQCLLTARGEQTGMVDLWSENDEALWQAATANRN